MVARIRINVRVDDEQLLEAIKKYDIKLQKGKRRIARSEAIYDYALTEGENPVKKSITRELKERNLSNQAAIERVVREIVGLEFTKRSPGDSIIWQMRLLNVHSPIDRRFISRGGRIATSRDLRELEAILSERLTADFQLFIEADMAAQIRKGEIPVSPPIKAVIVENILGENIGGKFEDTTSFISNIQFTILVRREMTKRMPKGSVVPRLPPPNPAKGLTFRSGEFVNTTEFFINFRDRTIGYYIAPPYNVFLDSGNPKILRYQPDSKTIIPSIRVVAKTLSAERFNIVRNINSIL